MINYIHAEHRDLNEIKKFIKDYWSPDHILVKDNEVFDHFFVYKNTIQFFLAKDSGGNIVGNLGYITDSQFDINLTQDTAWLSMWMSRPGLKEPVGIRLIKLLEDSLDVDYVASLGVGAQVIPIYQRMGYDIGPMHHLMKPVSENSIDINKNYFITDNLKEVQQNVTFDYKSNLFLEQKYTRKKFYNYSTFYVHEESSFITSIIGRVLHMPDSKKNIFRIVDFSGDINGISIFAKYASFKKLSKTIHYIDVLLSEASLVDNTVFEVCSSNKYLPLYFEPFISDYKEKNFCFKQLNQNINKNLLIITGDCDQERPNKRYNAT